MVDFFDFFGIVVGGEVVSGGVVSGLYAEGVASQSPGSRSAPWGTARRLDPYAEGVASRACDCVDGTPSEYTGSLSDRFPRVRC